MKLKRSTTPYQGEVITMPYKHEYHNPINDRKVLVSEDVQVTVLGAAEQKLVDSNDIYAKWIVVSVNDDTLVIANEDFERVYQDANIINSWGDMITEIKDAFGQQNDCK